MAQATAGAHADRAEANAWLGCALEDVNKALKPVEYLAKQASSLPVPSNGALPSDGSMLVAPSGAIARLQARADTLYKQGPWEKINSEQGTKDAKVAPFCHHVCGNMGNGKSRLINDVSDNESITNEDCSLVYSGRALRGTAIPTHVTFGKIAKKYAMHLYRHNESTLGALLGGKVSFELDPANGAVKSFTIKDEWRGKLTPTEYFAIYDINDLCVQPHPDAELEAMLAPPDPTTVRAVAVVPAAREAAVGGAGNGGGGDDLSAVATLWEAPMPFSDPKARIDKLHNQMKAATQSKVMLHHATYHQRASKQGYAGIGDCFVDVPGLLDNSHFIALVAERQLDHADSASLLMFERQGRFLSLNKEALKMFAQKLHSSPNFHLLVVMFSDGEQQDWCTMNVEQILDQVDREPTQPWGDKKYKNGVPRATRNTDPGNAQVAAYQEYIEDCVMFQLKALANDGKRKEDIASRISMHFLSRWQLQQAMASDDDQQREALLAASGYKGYMHALDMHRQIAHRKLVVDLIHGAAYSVLQPVAQAANQLGIMLSCGKAWSKECRFLMEPDEGDGPIADGGGGAAPDPSAAADGNTNTNNMPLLPMVKRLWHGNGPMGLQQQQQGGDRNGGAVECWRSLHASNDMAAPYLSSIVERRSAAILQLATASLSPAADEAFEVPISKLNKAFMDRSRQDRGRKKVDLEEMVLRELLGPVNKAIKQTCKEVAAAMGDLKRALTDRAKQLVDSAIAHKMQLADARGANRTPFVDAAREALRKAAQRKGAAEVEPAEEQVQNEANKKYEAWKKGITSKLTKQLLEAISKSVAEHLEKPVGMWANTAQGAAMASFRAQRDIGELVSTIADPEVPDNDIATKCKQRVQKAHFESALGAVAVDLERTLRDGQARLNDDVCIKMAGRLAAVIDLDKRQQLKAASVLKVYQAASQVAQQLLELLNRLLPCSSNGVHDGSSADVASTSRSPAGARLSCGRGRARASTSAGAQASGAQARAAMYEDPRVKPLRNLLQQIKDEMGEEEEDHDHAAKRAKLSADEEQRAAALTLMMLVGRRNPAPA